MDARFDDMYPDVLGATQVAYHNITKTRQVYIA